MNEISCSSWLRFLLFFSSLSLQFISGFTGDSSSSNDGKKNATSSNSKGKGVVIICVIILRMMNSRLNLGFGIETVSQFIGVHKLKVLVAQFFLQHPIPARAGKVGDSTGGTSSISNI
ncbi:hypothetical protein ACET3Z_001330 [Daucus carota]